MRKYRISLSGCFGFCSFVGFWSGLVWGICWFWLVCWFVFLFEGFFCGFVCAFLFSFCCCLGFLVFNLNEWVDYLRGNY